MFAKLVDFNTNYRGWTTVGLQYQANIAAKNEVDLKEKVFEAHAELVGGPTQRRQVSRTWRLNNLSVSIRMTLHWSA